MLTFEYLHGLLRKEAILQRRSAERTLTCVVIWTLHYSLFTTFIYTNPKVPLLFALISGGIMTILLPAWQLWFRKHALAHTGSDAYSKNIAIIGWNLDADLLIQNLKTSSHKPYRIVAHLTHGNHDTTRFSTNVAEVETIDDIKNLVESGRIDAVMIADHDMPSEELLQLQQLCGREVVEFMVMPLSHGLLQFGLRIQMVGTVPVLVDDNLPLQEPLNQSIKRGLDIIGATIGLACSIPVIALFGLLVYRESPGPIFYRQTRLGKKGKHFVIIKIRSMRLNAESGGNVGWSTQKDERRLKIGSLIRKLNIDELPQFWNVLKGDMSLVGPRPERPELIQNFKYSIEHYNFRHFVKPGITGWAQVNGWRGDTCLQKRINCDLEYMERWTIWLDIYVLILTLTTRKNAY